MHFLINVARRGTIAIVNVATAAMNQLQGYFVRSVVLEMSVAMATAATTES